MCQGPYWYPNALPYVLKDLSELSGMSVSVCVVSAAKKEVLDQVQAHLSLYDALVSLHSG